MSGLLLPPSAQKATIPSQVQINIGVNPVGLVMLSIIYSGGLQQYNAPLTPDDALAVCDAIHNAVHQARGIRGDALTDNGVRLHT